MRLSETQVPQARLWCARSGPDMRNVGWGGMGWDGMDGGRCEAHGQDGKMRSLWVDGIEGGAGRE